MLVTFAGAYQEDTVGPGMRRGGPVREMPADNQEQMVCGLQCEAAPPTAQSTFRVDVHPVDVCMHIYKFFLYLRSA
jgi:hypothetical protein